MGAKNDVHDIVENVKALCVFDNNVVGSFADIFNLYINLKLKLPGCDTN